MRFFSSPSHRFWFCTVALAVSSAVSADNFDHPELVHSQTDFGGVGLMQMPTARTAPEGEFTLGSTYNEDYIHFNTSLQLFPWLETTVRYTQVHDLLYSDDPGFSGDTKYTDKSIDAKLRLWKESFWLPELAVGVRDIGGTGLFDGEYIVGSKRAGPFDFSLGIGWGYLGNRANLKGDKNQSFDCGRDTSFSGRGGNVDIDRMFTGCTALFGGLEYQTPYAPLSLKLEYDGNDYQGDFVSTETGIPMEVNSPWNIGAVYRLGDWGAARLAYERGAAITAGISLNTNFNQVSSFWLDDKAPSYNPAAKRDDLSEEQWQTLSASLASVAGYKDNQIHFDGDTVTVTGEQRKYRNQDHAQTRAATLIANTGIDAKQYRIIDQAERQPITETVIDASTYAAVATNSYVGAHPDNARTRRQPQPTRGSLKAMERKRFEAGLAPVFVQSFGGSESFYMYSLGIGGNAAARLGDHLIASSSVYVNIADTYDKFKYTVPPDGTDLKRVRTLNRQYLEDTVRVTNMQLTYLDHWGNNWYTQTYGGYLETMFAGVGGEVLYRPMDSQFAVGLDANYVKQREPGSAFGLFKNEHQPAEDGNRAFRVQTGSTTGHATLYWQNPLGLFHGTLAKISAGRYLTEDVGVTVDVAKQFDSGITVGAYASKTDLSADEYGEGSFTKGFYVSIPFDLLSVKPTTSRGRLSWQPLQRDGGQKLNRKYSLYELTDDRAPWFARPATTD
ncbi:YjbH domain-containing protein [Salinivibrio kushneri]|uniref:YjbH domain-containing protein n=1 Tax=Salinivibrio kushneri TaxID=1908198 RepID=UPI0022B3CCCF|nr:YjbH domain-containing protein [Salinivibrio kushneri]WBA10873.1 YjbH domain-containing protein [Salinivibrio kushneri]